MTRAANCLALTAVAMWLAACASSAIPPCGPGERAMVSDRLFFGTARAGGEVSAAEWRGFLATDVTPRFPAGFTTWSAAGQWRGPDGRIAREASYVLEVVHDAGGASDAAISAIVADYKSRFAQESVLRLRSAACAAF